MASSWILFFSYGTGLCNLYFNNQVSKSLTYISRNFVTFSEYSTASDTSYEEITAARLLKIRCTYLPSQDQKYCQKHCGHVTGLAVEEYNDIKSCQNVDVGQRRFELSDGKNTCVIQDWLHADERPKTYMQLMSTPVWCSKE